MSISINPDGSARDVIVIGGSAGGIQAVIELLARLPADLPAFVGVVIHRGAATSADWSPVIGRKTALRVVEPQQGDPLVRGFVYIAPGDCHMRFTREHVALDGGPKEHGTRPAIDPLFASAATVFGRRVVGVVLSGGGHDGMQGLLDITSVGGLSLVQEPCEADFPAMPAYAIAHDHVSAVLDAADIGDAILALARGGVVCGRRHVDAHGIASMRSLA